MWIWVRMMMGNICEHIILSDSTTTATTAAREDERSGILQVSKYGRSIIIILL